jgi:hypothetical protein
MSKMGNRRATANGVLVLGVLLAVGVVGSSRAYCDSIAITSGEVFVDNSEPAQGFELRGSGLSFSGTIGQVEPWFPCLASPCHPGDVINQSVRVFSSAVLPVIQGTRFASANADLFFDVSPITIPTPGSEIFSLTLSAPFDMTGTITGFRSDGQAGERFTVFGHGHTLLGFLGSFDPQDVSVFHVFEGSAVPEPATWVLLVIGCAPIVRRGFRFHRPTLQAVTGSNSSFRSYR